MAIVLTHAQSLSPRAVPGYLKLALNDINYYYVPVATFLLKNDVIVKFDVLFLFLLSGMLHIIRLIPKCEVGVANIGTEIIHCANSEYAKFI